MSYVMPNRYELLYIIPATLTDEEVGGVETKVATVFTKVGASVESTRRLGKFRLAYPIKSQRHGHYVMVLFTAEPATMAKLDENLRLQSDVLRHLIVSAEEGGEQKFDLVQFTEVNVEDRPRRREKTEEKKEDRSEDLRSGVAALEKGKAEEISTSPAPTTETVSAEELEKKIELALSDDSKEV